MTGRTISDAAKVIEKGIPELAKAVDEGRIAVEGYNLCCLIHAMYELGIDPKLAEPGAEPSILKFTTG